jgi:hypothetical protein
MKIFVPGRICLFGEHSDWAGGYRRINADIEKGYTLICGTDQGIYADVAPHPTSLVLTTTTPDTPVEVAALAMLEGNIGCLPVLEGEALVGIISDRDIFRSLVDITGVRHGGHRVCLTVPDRPGSIRQVTDLIRSHGFGLQGILTSYEQVPHGSRRVVIRTGTAGDFEAMRADLEKAYSSVRIRKG